MMFVNRLLIFLFLTTAAFCVVELVFSSTIFRDPTKVAPHIINGLQIMTIFALLSSSTVFISGTKEPLLLLVVSNIVTVLVYGVFNVLIITGIVGTFKKWFVLFILSCKMVVYIFLTIVTLLFLKKSVKVQRPEQDINEETDYAFKRFGKYNFYFIKSVRTIIYQIFTFRPEQKHHLAVDKDFFAYNVID